MAARSASARRVRSGYVDQSRDTLEAARTVWEEISGGSDVLTVGTRTLQSREPYVASFTFKGTDQQSAWRELSGG